MSDGGFMGLAIAPWAPVIAAYVFGIATGWLIWGGARSAPRREGGETTVATAPEPDRRDDASDLKAKVSTGTTDADPCPAPMKLGALESEIRSARELLSQGDEEADAFSEELSTLDAGIKRANGRLKLVLRAVKRAAIER